jgi:NADH-quinone oxidoreductase subunit J
MSAGETVAFATLGAIILASGLASALVRRTFHSVMFLGVVLVAVAGLYILLGSPLIGVLQILVYVGGILTLFIFAVMFVSGDDKESDLPDRHVHEFSFRRLAGAAYVGLNFFAALVVAILLAYMVLHGAVGALAGIVGAAGTKFLGFLVGLLVFILAGLALWAAWLGFRHVQRTWSGTRMLGFAIAVLLAGLMASIVQATAPWKATASDATVASANDLTTLVDAMFGRQLIALEVLGVLLTAVMIGALVIARPLGVVPDEAHYQNVTKEQVAESQRVSEVGK